LKLAYAQFEELESFARFGARMDADTQKIVAHGRRIRECLKQTESSPVSVSEQITVLLALSEGLFDEISMAQMPAAARALHTAVAQLPQAIGARFQSAEKLKDEDRRAAIELARAALAPFQPSVATPVHASGAST
jgi:F-type H+-transporting ATPase subunit alpha